MIKGKVKKGDIVKLNNGKVGMVTYRKSNCEIGINFAHFHLMMSKPYSLKNKQDFLYRLGCDGLFNKEEISEIINPEKYK